MNIKIIAISGKQGSGKTTLANAIEKSLEGKELKRMKFADGVYQLHNSVLTDLKYFKKYTKINIDDNTKNGSLLQVLGQWTRDNIDDKYWVKYIHGRIKTLNDHNTDYIIIDDLRYENELKMLNLFDTTFIRLYCDESIRKERTESWRDNTNHESETGLDNIDFVWDYIIDTGNTDIEEMLEIIGKL